jgi:tetratricopeptide (TPR) repeat protein
MARFGRWEAILEEARPPEDLLYPTAIWHYVRGMALLRTGHADSARVELERVRSMSAADVTERMDVFGPATVHSVMQIATGMLAGEIAAADGDFDRAIELLRSATSTEDNLGYHEPPAWFSPVRQTLGAVFLEAGRPEEAEEAYREDLRKNPENGWSLFGLYQALQAQGQEREAAAVHERFRDAWSGADVKLESSRM